MVCGIAVAVQPGMGAEAGAGRGHTDDQGAADVVVRVPALQDDGTFEAGRSEAPQHSAYHIQIVARGRWRRGEADSIHASGGELSTHPAGSPQGPHRCAQTVDTNAPSHSEQVPRAARRPTTHRHTEPPRHAARAARHSRTARGVFAACWPIRTR